MPDEQKLYRQNVLDGFPNGCLLDLRVRLAMEVLRGPLLSNVPMTADGDDSFHAQRLAHMALAMTTELLATADAAGLIESLPEDGNLNAPMKKQAQRIGAFQFEQQASAQRMARDEQSGVVSPFGPRAN